MKSITKLSSIMEVLVVFTCLLSNHPVISEREILPRPQSGRSYKQHDVIPIIVNNIRSYLKAAETYGYYSLPFCLNHEQEGIKGLNDNRMRNNSSIIETETTDTFVKGGVPYQQSFRESLIGDHRESSPYHITFNDTIKDKLLCIQKINKSDVLKLRKAIQKEVLFEMYVEDLPMWGYIGDSYDSSWFTGRNERNFFDVFTHMIFHIGINEDKIVSLQVASEYSRAERIYDDDPPHEITFSYSVEFTKSEILWKIE